MTFSSFSRGSISFAIVAALAACGKEQAPAPKPPESTATPAAPSTSPSTPPASPSASNAPPVAPSTDASATTASAANASTNDARELAQKSGCLACHAVDTKLVGPAYKDVAAKYRGQPDVAAKLVQKVKNGGSGVWGPVPMPPNPQVSDADAKKLVDWVLSLK